MSSRHSFSASAGPGQAHLRLMAFSDLHMQILPHDYIAGRASPGQGLALVAAEARAAADEAANAALFDVGDAYQGGPLDADLARGALDPHPMAAALAAAGVDAATLGNHDFNHGLPALERWLSGPRPPIVLANVVRRLGATPRDDAPFLPPFAVLARRLVCGGGAEKTFRIGVIGVAPPQILDWDREHLAGALQVRDTVETVAAWVPEMRRQGADLVVVLAHTGIGAAEATSGMEHAAVPIAGVPGVDVVLAGHAHGLFPDAGFAASPGAEALVDAEAGLIHHTPAVMPGFWGRHLGVVDLLLSRAGEGWKVADRESTLRPVQATQQHPAVARAAEPYDRRARAEVRRSVGRAATQLHTYFALVADSPVVRLVNAAQLRAVRAARPDIAAAEGEVPLLAASAPLKAGGLHGPAHYTDVAPGTVRRSHLADLYTYPNTLLVAPITGADLRLWLERAACLFAEIVPGASDAPLLQRGHASYGFDTVTGATWRFDLSVPPALDAAGRRTGARGRVVDLRVGGRPVADHDTFRLVTNSYRLSNDPAGAAIRARSTAVADLSVAAALERYVALGGAEAALPPPAWGIRPMAETTALFATGPGARHVPPPGGAGAGVMHPTGRIDAAGFDLFRVDLGRADLLGPAEAAPEALDRQA